MTAGTGNSPFQNFIVAQIEGKPKKTYVCTVAIASDKDLFELPEDAKVIKMDAPFGRHKPILFYLTEVDPNMPDERKGEVE